MSDDIEFNEFYKIIFAPKLDGDEKCELVTQRLSQARYAPKFASFTDYLAQERKELATEVAKAEESPAGTAAGLKHSLQDANEGFRRIYAILIEGARKAPAGSISDDATDDLTRRYADLAAETVRLRRIAGENMALTASVTVRSKPLTLQMKP